jgi:tRNA modification GTPase
MLNADFRLLILDRSSPLTPEDKALLARVPLPRLIVANKSDLAPAWTDCGENNILSTSCRNKEGIEELLKAVVDAAMGNQLDQGVEQALLTRQRHSDALKKTIQYMQHVRDTLQRGDLGPEFVAGDLRSALDSLGEIVGKTTRGDVLDLIFSKFCIGK